jgi:hypothetical protein
MNTQNFFYLTAGYFMGYLTKKYSKTILFNCYKQYVLVSEYVQTKHEEYKKIYQDKKVNINMITKKLDNSLEINGQKYETDFIVYIYNKNGKNYYSTLLLTEDELDIEAEGPIISAYLINATKNEFIDITDSINSYLLHDGFIVFNENLKECYIKAHVANYDEKDTYYIEYIPRSDFMLQKISNSVIRLESDGQIIHDQLLM